MDQINIGPVICFLTQRSHLHNSASNVCFWRKTRS